MTYAENLWLYATLLFGIIIVPGMDMLFVLTNALTGGRRAGLAATAGMMASGATHTLIGAVAIGALTTLAPTVLMPVLFAGAAYMAWIGISLLRSSITVDDVGKACARSLWIAFRQAAITCLLNPKAYLFTIAVMPQFMKPQYGPLWSQALVMGMMTMAMQLAIYGGLALAASRSRDFLTSRPAVTMLAGRAAGALFIVAAGLTAWHGWESGV